MRVERVRLEDHPQVAIARVQVLDPAFSKIDPAGCGLVDPRDHQEGRSLAAARRAQEGDHLPGADFKVQSPEGYHLAEMLRQALQTDALALHPLTPPE